MDNNTYLTKEEYKEFINNNDYEGLANRLNKIVCNSKSEQIRLDKTIEEVRAEGKRKQELLTYADKDQQKAINFLSALNGDKNFPGLISQKDNNGDDIKGSQNEFSVDYIKAINQLGSKTTGKKHEMFGKDVLLPVTYNPIEFAVNRTLAIGTKKTKQYANQLVDYVFPRYKVPTESNNPDDIATSIAIRFEGKVNKRYGLSFDNFATDEVYKDSGYDVFLKQTGLTEQDLRNKRIKISKDPTDTNATIITLDKSNPDFINIIRSLNTITTTEDSSGEARYKIAGINSKGKYIKYANDSEATKYEGNNPLNIFTTSDRSKSDGIFYDPNYISDSWKALKDIEYKAKRYQEEVETKTKKIYKDVAVPSIISNTLGARDAEIEKRYAKGLLDSSTYNNLKTQNNAVFERGLMNYSLTQYTMYANDLDSDDYTTLHNLDKSKDKADIQEIIRNAVGTNRLSFSAAMINGKRGTMITIKPIMSKDTETGNDVEDIKQHTRQIFIENLFNNSVEESINRNTLTKTAYEYSQMLTYGYDLNIPEEGKLKVLGNNQAILTTTSGDEIYINDEKEIKQKIHKAVLIKDAAKNLNYTIFDANGKRRTDINNDSFKRISEERLNNIVIGAISELYPDVISEYNSLVKQINSGKSNIIEEDLEYYKNFILNETIKIKELIKKDLKFNLN